MAGYKPDLENVSFGVIGPGIFSRHFLNQILKKEARGVVMTITGSDQAIEFIEQINRTGVFEVDVRGSFKGEKTNETQTSEAFVAGYNLSRTGDEERDKKPLLDLVRGGRIKYLFTNTDDPEYTNTTLTGHLAEILYEAYKHHQQPPLIIPFELNPKGNGKKLMQELMGKISQGTYENNATGPGFMDYCQDQLQKRIVNTLVDSQADHHPTIRTRAVGEPFILLAIEKIPGLEKEQLPFREHPNIRLTEHFEDYNLIKFGLLNCIHTAMTQHWIANGKKVNGAVMPEATTRDFLSDSEYRKWAEALLAETKAVIEKALEKSPEGRAYLPEFLDELMPRLESEDFAKKHEKISTKHSGKLDERLWWLVLLAKEMGMDTDEKLPLLTKLLDNAVSRDQLKKAREDFEAALNDRPLFEQVRAIMGQYIPEVMEKPEEQIVTKNKLGIAFSRAAVKITKEISGEKMRLAAQALGIAYRDILGASHEVQK